MLVSFFFKISRCLLGAHTVVVKKKIFFFLLKVNPAFSVFSTYLRLFESNSFFFIINFVGLFKKKYFFQSMLPTPPVARDQDELTTVIDPEDEEVSEPYFFFFKGFAKKLKRLRRVKVLRRWLFLKKFTRLLWNKIYKVGSTSKNIRIFRYSFFKNYIFLRFFKQARRLQSIFSLFLQDFFFIKMFFLRSALNGAKVFFFKKKARLQYFFSKKKKVQKVVQQHSSIIKSTSMLRQFIFVFFSFCKIKNFFFFNNFSNFLSLLPTELLIYWQAASSTSAVCLNTRSTLWNLAYPWFFFFIDELQLLKKKSYCLNFFYIFLVNFAEKLLKSRVCFSLKNASLLINKFTIFIPWISGRASYKFKKFNRFFFFEEFLEVLCVSFFKKDIKFFEAWFVRFFIKIHFKLHKSFLFLFNKFLAEFFYIFKSFFFIKGFKLDVRGKVSVAGNSKKRHFLIKYGEISFSKKSSRLSYTQSIVPTSTGVLGVELLLVY